MRHAMYGINEHELSMDRAQVGQNKDLNMLRRGLKGLGMQAYELSHKLGKHGQYSKGIQSMNEVGT